MKYSIAGKICFLFISALIMVQGNAQNSWQLKTSKNGINVYTSTNTDSKIKSVKVECLLHATLTQLAAVISDIKTNDQWAYRTKNCTVLKQINPADLYYYAEIEMPWPVENRDYISHLKLSQNPVNRVMLIETENVPSFIPPKKDIVRIMQSVTKWVVSPQDDHTLKVEYTLFTDPGGNLPAWLINMFTIDGPLESFQKLREQLKKPAYVNAQIPGIKNF